MQAGLSCLTTPSYKTHMALYVARAQPLPPTHRIVSRRSFVRDKACYPDRHRHAQRDEHAPHASVGRAVLGSKAGAQLEGCDGDPQGGGENMQESSRCVEHSKQSRFTKADCNKTCMERAQQAYQLQLKPAKTDQHHGDRNMHAVNLIGACGCT